MSDCDFFRTRFLVFESLLFFKRNQRRRNLLLWKYHKVSSQLLLCKLNEKLGCKNKKREDGKGKKFPSFCLQVKIKGMISQAMNFTEETLKFLFTVKKNLGNEDEVKEMGWKKQNEEQEAEKEQSYLCIYDESTPSSFASKKKKESSLHLRDDEPFF